MHRVGTLLRDPVAAYPDVAAVAVCMGGTVAAPEITVQSSHPCAVGIDVIEDGIADQLSLDSPSWRLRSGEGVHEAEIAVRTRYGVGRPARIRYRRAG